MESYRPSAVVAAELESAREQLVDLRARISDAKEAIKQMEAEEKEFTGGWSHGGKLRTLQAEFARSQRRESDERSIPVVFSKVEAHARIKDFVIEKVTAKQIHARAIGTDNIERFYLDGVATRDWCKFEIDIQATFGVPEIDAKSWLKIKADHEASISVGTPENE